MELTHVDTVANMSNHNEAGDNKGAGLAFLIIALMMIGTPVAIGTAMGWFNLFGILGF
jgi:hypothetical protein